MNKISIQRWRYLIQTFRMGASAAFNKNQFVSLVCHLFPIEWLLIIGDVSAAKLLKSEPWRHSLVALLYINQPFSEQLAWLETSRLPQKHRRLFLWRNNRIIQLRIVFLDVETDGFLCWATGKSKSGFLCAIPLKRNEAVVCLMCVKNRKIKKLLVHSVNDLTVFHFSFTTTTNNFRIVSLYIFVKWVNMLCLTIFTEIVKQVNLENLCAKFNIFYDLLKNFLAM